MGRDNRDGHNAKFDAQQQKQANGVDKVIDSYVATSSAEFVYHGN